jgi:hypothetical protein
VRILLAGLIVGLVATGIAYAGQGESGAAPPPAGDSAAGELRDPAACGACTLRHRNLTRRAKELQAAEGARGACRIKGDITATGERLYYRPGDPAYAWTRIDEAAGERWFCSAEEAEAAGWRGPAD